ncbi:MAG: hypothetical protein ACLSB9_10090 [Hydrogeniiclostridium mannosilyticum]
MASPASSVMNVSIAQHCNTVRFSSTAWHMATTSRTGTTAPMRSELRRFCMAIISLNRDFAMSRPDIVFVTGWNEWIATRPTRCPESYCACDCADIDNSRDSEPMKGGFGDNYYMQLIAGIRRFGPAEQHAVARRRPLTPPALTSGQRSHYRRVPRFPR